MSDVLSPPENEQVIATLNKILELELAGLVRYLHYSFMIFGHNRIPIVGWLRDQAEESKTHATQAGEHITNLGGHPSLKIGSLLETHKHNVDEILAEALAHEEEGLAEYRKLLGRATGTQIAIASGIAIRASNQSSATAIAPAVTTTESTTATCTRV